MKTESQYQKNFHVIGIGGPKGSGKSTLANRITAFSECCFGMSTVVAPMAGALKNGTDRILGRHQEPYPGTYAKKDTEEVFGVTRRQAYQAVGQALRNVNENFWLEVWKSRNQKRRRVYVIDDVRYPNELSFIHSQRGFTIWIPGQPTDDQHVSEHSVSRSEFCCETTWRQGDPCYSFLAVCHTVANFLHRVKKDGL